MRSSFRFTCSLIASFVAVSAATADFEDRPFDFSDEFLLANGINPVGLIGRPNPNGPNAVIDNNVPGPEYRNVRVKNQASTFDHSGHVNYFYVTGLVFPNTFTNDAAGAEAREIAETYKIYEFPRAGAPQFSVFPKNQDSVADLTNGYFSNNPLGLWQVNIVRYTDAAFNSPQGQQSLGELAANNGYTLDGTPVIKTTSEIENLLDDGLITITIPPDDGVALRWFMCPVIEDPDGGAIQPDATLAVVSMPDGRPLPSHAEFKREFLCYQATGDNCDTTCNADVTVNRLIDVDDLLSVVSHWGSCGIPNCLDDVSGDQQVDIDDLLQVISAWGACQ
jgi:hypothetical protein